VKAAEGSITPQMPVRGRQPTAADHQQDRPTKSEGGTWSLRETKKAFFVIFLLGFHDRHANTAAAPRPAVFVHLPLGGGAPWSPRYRDTAHKGGNLVLRGWKARKA
jgi:hypothetical protein